MVTISDKFIVQERNPIFQTGFFCDTLALMFPKLQHGLQHGEKLGRAFQFGLQCFDFK